MKKFDPNEIFLNNFGRRITKTDTKIDSDPSTTFLNDRDCSTQLNSNKQYDKRSLFHLISFASYITKNISVGP